MFLKVSFATLLMVGGTAFYHSAVAQQRTNSPDIARALVSSDPKVQVAQQQDVLAALKQGGLTARTMELALVEVALGQEAAKAGPRALAMLVVAAKQVPNASSIFDRMAQVYSETALGGLRDVASYELAMNVQEPRAAHHVLQILKQPRDRIDSRAILRGLADTEAPEALAVLRQAKKEGLIVDPGARRLLQRLLP